MLTVGSVRVRYISHKDHCVLPSGGRSSRRSGNDERCYCSSSLPQISIANANNRNSLVYRSSLQWKHFIFFGSDNFDENQNNGNLFQEYNISVSGKPQLFTFHRQNLNSKNILDRFSNLRLGGENLGRGGKRGVEKKNRSSDKTERLKQITAKFSPPSTSELKQSNKEFDLSAAPLPDCNVSSKDDIFNLTFAKPESRTIVGAYTQRSIPFRSASFSQVDFLPEGKYVRQNETTYIKPKPPGSNTLPRKKIVEPIVQKRNVCSVERDMPKSTNNNFIGPKFSTRALTHPLGKPLSLSSTTNIPYNTSDNRGLRSLSYQKISESQLEEDIEFYHPPHASSLPPSPFPPPQPPKRNKHKLEKEAANSSKDESQSAEESLNIIKACCTQLSNFDQSPSSPNNNEMYLTTWFSVNGGENKSDVPSNESELADGSLDTIINTTTDSVHTELGESCEGLKEESTDLQPKEPNSGEFNIHHSIEISKSEENLTNKLTETEEPTSIVEPGINKLTSEPRFNPISPGYMRSTSTSKSLEISSENLKIEYQNGGNVERNSPQTYMFSRTGSVSEGDSDQGDKTREGTTSPSPMLPVDCSDYEHRMHKITSRPFSKKPLRGPLLEAEMKKMDVHKKLGKSDSDNFIFLDDIGQFQHRVTDGSNLERSYSVASPTTLPKRKNSIGVPYSVSETPTSKGIHHQRTTSSPSQLEGCAESNAELFEKLMKGSSERLLVPLESLACKNISKKNLDTRTHVVVELYETEKSYVEALQTIVQQYLEPLKSGDLDDRLIEPSVVDEIFHQVKNIYCVHGRHFFY
ncbi:hypothetical protein M8J75_011311 [Diaphorina citri]|nr:hypothetical protein M8J75_011311 [Diaphorina citri]